MTPSGIFTDRRMVAASPQPCGTRSMILYGAPTDACCCSRVTCAKTADGASAGPSAASMAKDHGFLNMKISSVALTVKRRAGPAVSGVRRRLEGPGHLSGKLQTGTHQRSMQV